MENSSNALHLVSETATVSDKAKEYFRYREGRVEIPDHVRAYVKFKGFYEDQLEFQVENISSFGARIERENNDHPLKLNDLYRDASLYIGGEKVFTGDFRIVNEFCESQACSYGISFLSETVDMNQISSIIGLSGRLSSFSTIKRLVSIAEQVDPKFKVLVADLNTGIQEIRQRLDEEEKHIKTSSRDSAHSKRMYEYAINMAMSLFSPEMEKMYGSFQTFVDGLPSEQIPVYKKYFRTNFQHLVDETPFMKRAYDKPLGYAGDYGLMLMFYEYEDLGKSLFAQFMHRHSCARPAAVANQNRVTFLSEILVELIEKSSNEKEFKFATIACGPARETYLTLKNINNQCPIPIKAILVDQEKSALDHAHKTIMPIANQRGKTNLVLLREDAVLGIIKGKKFTTEFEGSDVIISAGLFDYLSDRVATKLIGSMYKFLKPGGQLLIGNVSTRNPDKFSMDFFMEWNLVLRNERDMLNLVPEEILKDPGAVSEVISESLGLNIFLRLIKPGG